MQNGMYFLLQQKKQIRIFNTLKNLQNLPKVSVTSDNNFNNIYVTHNQEFVPDFDFRWCNQKEHYRVYILVANRESIKRVYGYPICTIATSLSAMGFGVMYQFLHKHRANNKE